MSYYTVRRDDSEIRVVKCPKCNNADVKKYSDVIPYRWDNYLLRLMQCNVCNCYFTFYREDGLKEISQELALESISKDRVDMNSDGSDKHRHSFYIVFKEKPPTISGDRYDYLLGFTQDDKGNYISDSNIEFEKFVKNFPSINTIIRYKEQIKNIDFQNMQYLEESKSEWFG